MATPDLRGATHRRDLSGSYPGKPYRCSAGFGFVLGQPMIPRGAELYRTDFVPVKLPHLASLCDSSDYDVMKPGCEDKWPVGLNVLTGFATISTDVWLAPSDLAASRCDRLSAELSRGRATVV